MPIEYENRRGDRYYVLEGRTKTGKPKYYCSKKAQGVRVERMPDGFEIYENPRDAVVVIRRVRTSPILPIEKEMLEKWLREYAAEAPSIVEINGAALVVYSADIDPDRMTAMMGLVEANRRSKEAKTYILRQSTYSPMFRFELIDEEERLYAVQRWCFSSAIDDWYFLGGGAPLEVLAREYLPHLGKESFFELM
ncbi:MAG: hypothetical protein WD894_12320 [Pirellulales bacterium]